MKPASLEVIGLAYSVDHYVDGICGNIWEVYAIPEEGLPPELQEEPLPARDFTTGRVLGTIFPGEGMIDFRGPFDEDYDASEETSFDMKVAAKNRELMDLGEIHSIYS